MNIKWISILYISLMACLGLLSCRSNSKNSNHQIQMLVSDKSTIQSPMVQMKIFSELMGELIPYYGADVDIGPTKTSHLQATLGRFKTTSFHANQGIGRLGPLYESATKYLVKETNQALWYLEQNRPKLAIEISKKMVGACITCHTQSSSYSRQWPDPWNLNSKISNKDKANYYLATRQYDNALDSYNTVLTEHRKGELPVAQWYESTTRSLAVAIRVKKNPSLALEVVSSLFDAKSVPDHLAQGCRLWQRSLKKWRTEIKQHKDLKTKNPKIIINEIEQWLARMESENKAKQYYLIDRLRISEALNNLMLQSDIQSKHLAQAYLLAGINSKYLEDVDLTSPSLFYYQACIRTLPKSDLAARCFENYEKTVQLLQAELPKNQGTVKSEILSEQDELRGLAL